MFTKKDRPSARLDRALVCLVVRLLSDINDASITFALLVIWFGASVENDRIFLVFKAL